MAATATSFAFRNAPRKCETPCMQIARGGSSSQTRLGLRWHLARRSIVTRARGRYTRWQTHPLLPTCNPVRATLCESGMHRARIHAEYPLLEFYRGVRSSVPSQSRSPSFVPLPRSLTLSACRSSIPSTSLPSPSASALDSLSSHFPFPTVSDDPRDIATRYRRPLRDPFSSYDLAKRARAAETPISRGKNKLCGCYCKRSDRACRFRFFSSGTSGVRFKALRIDRREKRTYICGRLWVSAILHNTIFIIA